MTAVKNSTWSAVGATTLNALSTGALVAIPSTAAPDYQCTFQADFITNPTYRLGLRFDNVALTAGAANAQIMLAHGEEFQATLAAGTVVQWGVFDSSDTAQNGGANDYLRVTAVQ